MVPAEKPEDNENIYVLKKNKIRGNTPDFCGGAPGGCKTAAENSKKHEDCY